MDASKRNMTLTELLNDREFLTQNDVWLRRQAKARRGEDFLEDEKPRKRNSLLSDPAASIDDIK